MDDLSKASASALNVEHDLVNQSQDIDTKRLHYLQDCPVRDVTDADLEQLGMRCEVRLVRCDSVKTEMFVCKTQTERIHKYSNQDNKHCLSCPPSSSSILKSNVSFSLKQEPLYDTSQSTSTSSPPSTGVHQVSMGFKVESISTTADEWDENENIVRKKKCETLPNAPIFGSDSVGVPMVTANADIDTGMLSNMIFTYV